MAPSLQEGFSKMPSRSADFEEIWAYLRVGINSIMNDPESASPKDGICLYTTVYNFFTSGREQRLYDSIGDYFVEHLKPLSQGGKALTYDDLLRYYAAEWDRYTAGARHLNRAFMYLNRYWVAARRREGVRGVLPVYTLALSKWKGHFFIPIQNDNRKLADAIHCLITRQRNDEAIDRMILKTVIGSFVSIGLDTTKPDQDCLDVYKEHIEATICAASEEYYRQESDAFFSAISFPEYLKRAEQCLREENGIVDAYLHSSTRKELIGICENVFFSERSDIILDNFHTFLEFNQHENVKRTYALLSHIPHLLALLREAFEAHVEQVGFASVFDRSNSTKCLLDPKTYTNRLLDVHRKYSCFLRREFEGDPAFTTSFDRACREFVNRNAATRRSSKQSAELIAKRADMLLRKNNKMASDEELEKALKDVMTLFRYVQDKDVFLGVYASRLAKRMKDGVSISEAAEWSMISMLKDACGVEYTKELQRMVNSAKTTADINSSTTHLAQNHHEGEATPPNTLVLWPLNASSSRVDTLVDVLSMYAQFQLCKDAGQGHRFTWLRNRSKVELHTNYLKRKYIFLTGAYQTVVLLQYNQHDTMTLGELVSATLIPKDVLTDVLAALVKRKVLFKEKMRRYELNMDFRSKAIRVNFDVPLEAEVRAESAEVFRATSEERSHIIRATIVRLMKVRRVMTRLTLICEVVSQIGHCFQPTVPAVEMAMRTLNEKDVVEFVEGSRGPTVVYIA